MTPTKGTNNSKERIALAPPSMFIAVKIGRSAVFSVLYKERNLGGAVSLLSLLLIFPLHQPCTNPPKQNEPFNFCLCSDIALKSIGFSSECKNW